MQIKKIAAILCILMPMSAIAEYRMHIPITDKFKGPLTDNSIIFNNNPSNGGNGSNESDLVLTDGYGDAKCAFNSNNYVVEEVTANFVYTYEFKSTHFSVPLTRQTGYSSLLEYNNKFYEMYWTENPQTEIIGTGQDRITRSYYSICESTEIAG